MNSNMTVGPTFNSGSISYTTIKKIGAKGKIYVNPKAPINTNKAWESMFAQKISHATTGGKGLHRISPENAEDLFELAGKKLDRIIPVPEGDIYIKNEYSVTRSGETRMFSKIFSNYPDKGSPIIEFRAPVKYWITQ